MTGPLSHPPLSVIVPFHDAVRSLESCLVAVFAALPAGGEVIVVDDASRDASYNLARRFPVRMLRHEMKRGPSAARNTGWRACSSDLIVFVDADVRVAPDSFRLLMEAMDNPEVGGVNGILSLDCPHCDTVSDYVNASIHYQHLRHGSCIASAFTSLCLLRRSTLEAMGGWSEAWASRYADDVSSRFHLPPGFLRMDPRAQGRHDKRVALSGFLKHRFNVGYHYFRSLRVYSPILRERPGLSILSVRYPINTALAALSLCALPMVVFVPGMAVLTLGMIGLAFVMVNLGFMRFMARNRRPRDVIASLPLSVIEGYAYLSGMTAGILARGDRIVDEPTEVTDDAPIVV